MPDKRHNTIRRLLLRTSVPFLACLTSLNTTAQSGLVTLFKNPLVYEFVRSTEVGYSSCMLLSLAYWDAIQLARFGSSNHEAKQKELSACIQKQRDVPRQPLVTALKYLSERPGASKAAKAYYISWTESLDALEPSGQEDERSNAQRKIRTAALATRALRELELELQLGT